MQTLEQSITSWTAGALVFVQTLADDDAQVRPAAFVFARPGGLLWVEPGYADPAGAAGNALHDRDGEAVATGLGFVLTTAAGERITLLPYDPAAGDGDMVGGALEWFAEYLARAGVPWAIERARVSALLELASA